MLTPVERIIANFEALGDWTERYRYIIDLGRKLPGLPENCRVECNRVDGCVSRVWLVRGPEADAMRELVERAVQAEEVAAGREEEGAEASGMYFNADSDAHIVRGLVAILLHIYCGKSPEEVLELDPKPIFHRLGLDTHLSPSRSNGLYAMVRRLRQLAAEEIARRNRGGAHASSPGPGAADADTQRDGMRRASGEGVGV